MFTLNIGTELEQVLTLVSVVASIAAVLWASRMLPASGLKRYFLLALVFLPMYLNLKLFLEADDLLTPSGVFDIWFRHAFFYIGQLFFFFFISKIFAEKVGEQRSRDARLILSVLVALYLAVLISPPAVLAFDTVNILRIPKTPYNILLFLTDQGIQHVVAIVFFFVTLAIVRIQAAHADFAPLRKASSRLLWANSFFIFVHIWEYAAESMHLLPFLPHETIELVEYGFNFAGLFLLFYWGLSYFRQKAVGA